MSVHKTSQTKRGRFCWLTTQYLYPLSLATKLWFLLGVALDQLKKLHFPASFAGSVAKPFLINSMWEVGWSFQESSKNGVDSTEILFSLSLFLFLHAWNEDIMPGVAAAILWLWSWKPGIKDNRERQNEHCTGILGDTPHQPCTFF